MAYECDLHGNRLRHAVTDEGRYVNVLEAKSNRERSYHCPGCGIPVRPVKEAPIRSQDYTRMSHFRTYPQEEGHGRAKRAGDLELALNVMASDLSYSGDLGSVLTGMTYVSETKQGEVWQEHERFPIGLYASRQAREPVSAFIHVHNPPRDGVNDLYKRLKEIAQEPSPSRKRRFLYSEDESIELPRKLHQNIVVLRNEHTYREREAMLELTPNLYNFVAYLTDRLNFFDAHTLGLQQARLNDEGPVSQHSQNPNRYFSVSSTHLPHYSLQANRPVERTRRMSNRAGFSIHLPAWKLADFAPVFLDQHGRPASVKRRSGQLDFVFH